MVARSQPCARTSGGSRGLATARHRRRPRGSGRSAAGLARHAPQIARRRRLERHAAHAAAGLPEEFDLVQQSAQKPCTSATIVPHPAQRGGSAKSSAPARRMSGSGSQPSAACRWRRAIAQVARWRSCSTWSYARRGATAPRAGRPNCSCSNAPSRTASNGCRSSSNASHMRFCSAARIPVGRLGLADFAAAVDVRDPGPALRASRRWRAGRRGPVGSRTQGKYDLVLAIGTLDTVNDLPRRPARHALRAEARRLPDRRDVRRKHPAALARARCARPTRCGGAASPHVHPRIEAAALAPLLERAGFVNPVVDIDRIARRLCDRSTELVADLAARWRATNVLTERSARPLSRRPLAAAAGDFAAVGHDGRTVETFEILHFAGWSHAGKKSDDAR